MRTRTILAVFCLAIAGLAGATPRHRWWAAAGKIRLAGDLPTRLIVSGNGRQLLAITSGGHRPAVYRINLKSGKVVQSLAVGRAWAGACQSADGKTLYLSTGGPPSNEFPVAKGLSPATLEALKFPIVRVDLQTGLKVLGGMSIQGLDDTNRWVGGLAAGPDGAIYALNLPNRTVYEIEQIGVSTAKVGAAPGRVVVSPDGRVIAVSNFGDGSVSFLDWEGLSLISKVGAGVGPREMVWSKDGGTIFVACLAADYVVEICREQPFDPNVMFHSPRMEPPFYQVQEHIKLGRRVRVAPDAVALSADGKRLFVAEANVNRVAVVDVSLIGHSRLVGFIPTGRYPSALAVSLDGRRLYVGVGFGQRGGAVQVFRLRR
jgi:DNA-binding beta-propeller fold protein YncE